MTTPHPAHSRPQRIVIDGRYVRLEPIGPQHAATLYQASKGDEARFAYLPTMPPESESGLGEWITRVAAIDDPLYFAVIDKASGRCEGRQALMNIVPEHGTIEIGGIYWGPNMARTRLATETLFLSARYAFDELGYRRFEWKCNNLNEPSKKAALRFGFKPEGVFRQHMIVKGQSRDTAWFSIIDGEWPELKAEYERWLEPANFEVDGTQKTALRFG